MAKWQLVIDVKDIWKKGHTRELDIKEFVKLLYDRLSTYTQKINSFSLDADAVAVFDDLMSELSDAEFEDYDDFDSWLCEFYNFCDDYRFWFQTF